MLKMKRLIWLLVPKICLAKESIQSFEAWIMWMWCWNPKWNFWIKCLKIQIQIQTFISACFLGWVGLWKSATTLRWTERARPWWRHTELQTLPQHRRGPEAGRPDVGTSVTHLWIYPHRNQPGLLLIHHSKSQNKFDHQRHEQKFKIHSTFPAPWPWEMQHIHSDICNIFTA